jgi:O-antigen/teichoic acid export membrane protein
MGVTLMAVAYALKEFHTRHAFNEDRGGRAVLIHATLALLLLLGTVGVALWGATMSLELAFVLYAGAHAGAALTGHALAGLPMRGHSLVAMRADLVEIATGGRWAALTNLVYFLRTHAHTIVVTLALGVVSVAQLQAARLLVTPALLVIPAMSQVALPRIAATVRSEGWPAVLILQRRVAISMFAIAVIYSVALLSAWPMLSGWVLGGEYSDLFGVAALWCVFAGILAVRNSFEWVVQAMRMFRQLTVISALCAPIALISVWGIASLGGLEGAVLGVIVGELAMVLGVGYLVLRSPKGIV